MPAVQSWWMPEFTEPLKTIHPAPALVKAPSGTRCSKFHLRAPQTELPLAMAVSHMPVVATVAVAR